MKTLCAVLAGLAFSATFTAVFAQPTPNGDVTISNVCEHPVQVAVSWEDPLDGWRTEGWWAFAPSEASSLKSEDGQIRTANGFLHVWAQATDDSGLVWEAKDAEFQENIDGKSYNMVEIELEAENDGSWVLPLLCEGA